MLDEMKHENEMKKHAKASSSGSWPRVSSLRHNTRARGLNLICESRQEFVHRAALGARPGSWGSERRPNGSLLVCAFKFEFGLSECQAREVHLTKERQIMMAAK